MQYFKNKPGFCQLLQLDFSLKTFSPQNCSGLPIHKLFKTQYPSSEYLVAMNERIFYIDQNTDLSEITTALKNTKADTVVFVLPQKSIIFESIVNLQILRGEAEEKKKNLIIISKYAKGRKMCETGGIEAHDTLEHWEKKIPHHTVAAKKNVPADFSSTSRIRRVPIVIDTGAEDQGQESSEPTNWRELLARPSWQALSGLLAFSVGLFLFLSFLAFPGATLEIKPEKKGMEIITNIKLINSEKQETVTLSPHENTILGFPIESIFEKEMDFSTITKEFQGSNASGELVILNTFPEERRLRPTTRFQTDTGIIFRIDDWVVLPAATLDAQGAIVPGERIVTVQADEKDIYGELIGERGNITPRKFFLPGLEPSARKNLWAESYIPFNGGFTDWVPRITQADIDAAQRKIEAELLASATEDMQRFVTEKNAREQEDLVLLLGDKFEERTIMDIIVEDNILGTTQESFHISARLKVRTWAYSMAELYELIWNEFSTKTDRRTQLAAIDINTSSPELLERDEENGMLKISVAARGAQEFLIDPRSEAGIRFVNKIKEQIVGIDVAQAEAIVANQEEVSEVNISIWPFWSRNIPNLPENIAIKLVHDESI